MKFPPLLSLITLLCLPAPASRAGQVNWGSAFSLPKLYSSGAPMDTQMTFELGVFAGGFTPTAANTAQWAANWRRASVTFYNPQISYFSGVHPVVSNASPFLAGTRGYIWGHTGQCSGGEWVLLTAPEWGWPGSSPLALPVNWFVSGATQVIVGSANSLPGFELKTAAVSAPLPLLTWAEWRQRMFSAAQLADPQVSGDQADPDHDGVVNLAEFALGTNAFIASPPGRVEAGEIMDAGRRRLTLTVTKRCDRHILWTAAASRDLLTWPAGSVVVMAESPETVTFRENLSLENEPRIFMRPVFSVP